MRKLLVAIIALLAVVLCLVVTAIGYFVFVPTQGISSAVNPPTPVIVPVQSAAPTLTPRATKANSPAQAPTHSAGETTKPQGNAEANSAHSTLDQLSSIQYPSNDRIQLAEEFKGVVPNLATPGAPKQYKVGDKETFWVNRDMQSDNQKVTATLRYMNDVVYMWVEDGERIDQAALKKSADVFAAKIYPTDRKYLGSEANPGVDNDPHLHILNTRFENASGYFSQSDTLPVQVNRFSNDKEMFYVSTRSLRPGSDVYDSVLAHEFAHMIHRNQNPRGESSWITEGFGDLGVELSGYPTGHEQSFAADPDIQLNAWASGPGLTIPHYGAAYLFMSYQLNRFGIDYIRDLFSTDTTGIATIQRALDKHQTGLTFDQLFADWVVANFINAPELGSRYNYATGDLNIRPTTAYDNYPAQGTDTVHQYGTDYIQLLPKGKEITFKFDGADTVRAIPTDPFSGKYFWWSGRTDFSDARLTRAFDLSTVNTATLNFATWYDLEPDFDYAYASISTDSGKTWKTLKGNTTTGHDPNAANYGNAFNCKSLVGCDPQSQPQWIHETINLTPYVGQKILLRFEQITDEVYTDGGFALDDISIPEIHFQDNAENGDAGWIAEGFARTDNILPQKFIVQAIEFGSTPRIVPIPLDEHNAGTYTTSAFGKDTSQVVIAISGSTPVTWETADYHYSIQ